MMDSIVGVCLKKEVKNLIKISLFVIFAISISIPLAYAESYQTWSMVVTSNSGSYYGTLNVDSDGYFTASGFTGHTDSGTYSISVEGYMSGTYISFTESASYSGGYISGTGEGTLNAAFPSATSASGTISGTISDPLGTRSFSMSFTATKTGGGDGSFELGGTPVSWAIAAIVGIFVFSAIAAAISHNHSVQKKRQMQASMGPIRQEAPVQWRSSRPMNPQYGTPDSPYMQTPSTGIQGSLTPSPITMDNGVLITGQGASVEPQWLPWLTANWAPDAVTLNWTEPQFDRSRYVLLGYDISQQTYGPTSTAAQSIFRGRVPPNSTSTTIPFNQTYQWNTNGDIAGFRVDPVFGQITPQGQISQPFRTGGIGIRIGEPFGTFGIGP